MVLGVAGGIAAYKAVELLRLLVAAGAEVHSVLTPEATRFVAPLTFGALAGRPALTGLWDGPDPIPHTRLGQDADVVVVAPATAHLIGRYAAGLADDLLTNTLLATRAPVLLAAAMHTEMWEQAAVKRNVARLRADGIHVLDPEVGPLAGGDVGPGRLVEPERILEAVEDVLVSASPERPGPLTGRTILVSAGGTREPIDPVRFIGNRSSGRMGHAVAAEASRRGADVVLVTTSPLPVPAGAKVEVVETAAEMADAVLGRSGEADAVVMTAAVADFTPAGVAPRKLKKAAGAPEIRLVPTRDVLAELGRRKGDRVLVGFAAETDDVAAAGAAKVAAKNLDLLVANLVGVDDSGFGSETNRAYFCSPGGVVEELGLLSKKELASLICDRVGALLETRRTDS